MIFTLDFTQTMNSDWFLGKCLILSTFGCDAWFIGKNMYLQSFLSSNVFDRTYFNPSNLEQPNKSIYGAKKD